LVALLNRKIRKATSSHLSATACDNAGYNHCFGWSTIVTPLGPVPVIWTITSPSFAQAK